MYIWLVLSTPDVVGQDDGIIRTKYRILVTSKTTLLFSLFGLNY